MCAPQVATTVNAVAVALHFNASERVQQYVPPNCTADIRHGILFFYFSYVVFVSWKALGFAPLWFLQTCLYLVSFAAAKTVDDYGKTLTEPVCLWHHHRGVWSLHEDFHTLLASADIVSAVAAFHYFDSPAWVSWW